MIATGREPSLAKDLKLDEVTNVSSPLLPEKSILVACGAVSLDYLASVATFPQPDDKIRSTELKVQGGGNAGNASTTAAKLGLKPRIISKVANDAFGKLILDELQADGIDTSFMVVSESGTSSFTYVIVDRETNTRTCINSPGFPPMDPKELSHFALTAALSGASIVYFDGRLPETAIVVAKEAEQRQIPILVDAERKREGLDDLLAIANYVVCSSKFPQSWTEAPTLPEALFEMAYRLQRLKFVIVTLGAAGCVMLQRTASDSSGVDAMDVNMVYEALVNEIEGQKKSQPFVVSSKVALLRKKSDDGKTPKEITGRILVGTAEDIQSSELVDTTGSGDAFIGSVLYALCAGLPPEKMLVLGAIVAGANCRALGARGGLPQHSDSRVLRVIQSEL